LWTGNELNYQYPLSRDENPHILVPGSLCMDLFILRHGKAGKLSGGTDDAARALTRKGEKEIERVAQWMKAQEFSFDIIATSPLQRARETATVIASVLGQKDKLTTWDELAPGGDPDTVCYTAAQQGNDAKVLVIGHEPGLSRLISMIITGNPDGSIVLSKGGLAKIGSYSFTTRPSGDLQWLLTPKQILAMQQTNPNG
jgi:phosphohistidine phosphatase